MGREIQAHELAPRDGLVRHHRLPPLRQQPRPELSQERLPTGFVRLEAWGRDGLLWSARWGKLRDFAREDGRGGLVLLLLGGAWSAATRSGHTEANDQIIGSQRASASRCRRAR